MIKPSTIHVVLTVAAMKNWIIREHDVKNAFSNKFLKKHLYGAATLIC